MAPSFQILGDAISFDDGNSNTFSQKSDYLVSTSVVDVYLEHFTEELTVLKLVQVATDLKLGQTFHKNIFL